MPWAVTRYDPALGIDIKYNRATMEMTPAVPNPDAPGSPLLPVEESRRMLSRALARFFAHEHARPADPDNTGTMAEVRLHLRPPPPPPLPSPPAATTFN